MLQSIDYLITSNDFTLKLTRSSKIQVILLTMKMFANCCQISLKLEIKKKILTVMTRNSPASQIKVQPLNFTRKIYQNLFSVATSTGTIDDFLNTFPIVTVSVNCVDPFCSA